MNKASTTLIIDAIINYALEGNQGRSSDSRITQPFHSKASTPALRRFACPLQPVKSRLITVAIVATRVLNIK
jgi:hypothetical protein